MKQILITILSILINILSFLFIKATVILNIFSTILFIFGILVIFNKSYMGAIGILIMGYLISLYGIPKMALNLVEKLEKKRDELKYN
ncbi:CD1845 family protein [Helcococcus bovis]|uniref:CD1845 family protein n=1 Tax=Helcococcus bovis TaxID=3153252 RepID=UPI0038B76C10